MGASKGNIPPMSERRIPGLSATLDGRKHPHICQGCDQTPDDSVELEQWREHDPNDRPTYTIVVLCRTCSGRLIEPHPRLYTKLEPFRPVPGVMGLCVACTRRDGTDCTSTQLKRNGGSGLQIDYPKPSFSGFLCRGPGSGPMTVFSGPALKCADREEVTP